MNELAIGDLVVSSWGKLQPLADDLGLIVGVAEGFTQPDYKNGDWCVYNVYWLQAGNVYPVFSHDIVLFRGYKDESII